MPEHGEERNRHTHREIKMTDFVDLETGKPINIPYVAQQGTRAEKWCVVCQEWVLVGSGLQGWLIGFMICPQCNTDWSAKL